MHQKTSTCKNTVQENKLDLPLGTTKVPVRTPSASPSGSAMPDRTPAPSKKPNLLAFQALTGDALHRELSPRPIKTLSMDSQWKFSKIGLSESEVSEVVAPGFDDSGYEAISLPHTWNAEDGADGWLTKDEDGNSYDRGNGVYRKVLELEQEEWSGKRIYLSFEGG